MNVSKMRFQALNDQMIKENDDSQRRRLKIGPDRCITGDEYLRAASDQEGKI